MLHTCVLPTLLPFQTSFSAHNSQHTNLGNHLTRLQLSSLALSSLILCNLQAPSKYHLFSSLFSSSFLQPRSLLTATPATILLPSTSCQCSHHFFPSSYAAFPPLHHTLDTCSRQGLASNFHIFCLCPPPSLHSLTSYIQFLPPNSQPFPPSYKCTFPLIPLPNNTP